MVVKQRKNGFTLVELSIVIAVIAILIAVLIPTFISLINSANNSSDEQTVKNMNTALMIEEIENEKPEYLCQVWDVLEDAGYNPAPTPNYSDNAFYWYKTDNVILIYSISEGQFTFPSDYAGTVLQVTASTSVNLAKTTVATAKTAITSWDNLVELDTYVYSTSAHDSNFTDGDICAYCGKSIAEDPQHEHNYTAEWSWTDYTAATVTLTCPECKVTHTETATITSETTEEATCTATGTVEYTATVTYDGNTYTDTKADTIAKKEHTYSSSETVDYITTDTGSTLVYIGGIKEVCDVCGHVELSGGIEQSKMGYDYTNTDYTEKYEYNGTVLTGYNADNDEWNSEIKVEIPYGTTAIGTKDDDKNSGVLSINNYDFSAYITELILPSTLECIYHYAFQGQNKLTSIEIPASVTYIGDHAFESCSSLTEVVFKEGSCLETIGTSAFENCGLTYIIIPETVKYIGELAFNIDWGNISAIYYCGTADDWSGISKKENHEVSIEVSIIASSSTELYYYSESKPSDSTGNYWYYDEDDNPVIW